MITTAANTQFFVTSFNTPVSGFDFETVNVVLAGDAAHTKIFATHAEGVAWVGMYLSAYELGMVVPLSELDSYFNGGEEASQKELAFTDTEENIFGIIMKEGIDLDTIEFKPWMEKFSTYTAMQQQNIQAGDDIHEAISYCATQMFINGEYRFDIATRRSWSEVVIHAEKFNLLLAALKAKAKGTAMAKPAEKKYHSQPQEARATFLAAYAAEIGDNPSATQNNLMRMFALAGDQLPIHGGKAWFYKAWRQVDIIDAPTGEYDMMVWNLISRDEATHAVVERLITAD